MIQAQKILAIGNDRLRRLATYASIGVAFTLITAKLYAYLSTDSVAMMSSLLDSTIDLLSSMVTAFGVASALQPPDREHRFGHGKAEPLSALAQAAFIVGSSVLLGYEAISRFYHPQDIQREDLGYGVMGLAIVLTLVLVTFQHVVTERTRSMAIKADRMHYVGDLLVNLAVMGAFALHQWTGITWIDPLFAIVVAVCLSAMAIRIARHALVILMDSELSDNDREKIKTIVCNCPSVHGMHDLRTRSDSDRVFIEMHVEMDATMPLNKAHAVSEKIIEMLQKEYPDADVIIHQDPVGLDEVRLDEKIDRVGSGII